MTLLSSLSLRVTALLLLVMFAGSALARAEEEEPFGVLRGSVVDKDFEVPLPLVRVTILETLQSALTTADGQFVFERVRPGVCTLTFSKDGFDRLVMTEVFVTAGRLTDIRAEVVSEVFELEELVVSGTDLLAGSEMGLLEIRADALNVQDSISAEFIGKAGAGDAGGALKLVVGASVSDGKYATVRGLSDRYTGITLNGIRVPSADPRRRAVQVDMLPTGTIESVNVTKTFTPDLSGEFTGGGVDIRTKSVPEEEILQYGFSIEGNSLATGNGSFLSYQDGGVSPYGFGTSRRALPGEASDPLPVFPTPGFNPSATQRGNAAAYDRLAHSFDPVIGVQSNSPSPNHGLSLLWGNRFEIGESVLGAVAAVSWSRKFDFYEKGQNNTAVVSDASQPIGIVRQREDSRGVDEMLAGVLGNVTLRLNDRHQFALRLIGNQSAEDVARFQVEDAGYPSVEQNQALQYTERSLRSQQLSGEHRFGEDAVIAQGFGGLLLDWALASNATSQNEPDVRFFRNSFNYANLSAEMPANSTPSQNTRRIYREIGETNGQAAVNITLPFTQWHGAEGRLKAGHLLDLTQRDYDQLSYTYNFATQFGPFTNADVRENRGIARFTATSPDQLWTDVFLDDSRLGLASNTPPAPNQLLWTIGPVGNDVIYDAEQEVAALYGMIDLPLGETLRLTAGARHERTDIAIDPRAVAGTRLEVIEIQPGGDRGLVSIPQEAAGARIQAGTTLPSVGLIWEMASRMNGRLSWTRTLARPTFRELAPVATEEFIFGDEFIGQPALRLSSITNYDARWEWFPRSGTVLSASVFYKSIEDPIELISFSAGGRTFIQPINYGKGEVRGVEVEARGDLSPIARWLKGVNAGINYTRLDSSVEVPLSEQESLAAFGLDEPERRLQGQPDYLLNVNLGYDNDRAGTSVNLFYNLTGATLVTGAARGVSDGIPNVFEKPFGALDVSINQRVSAQMSLVFRGRNVLAQERLSAYRTPGGGEAVKSARETASLWSLAASFRW